MTGREILKQLRVLGSSFSRRKTKSFLHAQTYCLPFASESQLRSQTGFLLDPGDSQKGMGWPFLPSQTSRPRLEADVLVYIVSFFSWRWVGTTVARTLAGSPPHDWRGCTGHFPCFWLQDQPPVMPSSIVQTSSGEALGNAYSGPCRCVGVDNRMLPFFPPGYFWLLAHMY